MCLGQTHIPTLPYITSSDHPTKQLTTIGSTCDCVYNITSRLYIQQHEALFVGHVGCPKYGGGCVRVVGGTFISVCVIPYNMHHIAIYGVGVVQSQSPLCVCVITYTRWSTCVDC